MEVCPFFEEDEKIITSQEIRADRMRQSQRLYTCWCTHPIGAPVDRRQARSLGQAKALSCGGDFDKCPIDPEIFLQGFEQ